MSTMHRAGADFVMSYASMGANAVFNWLRRSDILMVAEGLNFFRVPVPRPLAGRSVAECESFGGEGWSVVAVKADGRVELNPPPSLKLPADGQIIALGSEEAEERFLRRYGEL